MLNAAQTVRAISIFVFGVGILAAGGLGCSAPARRSQPALLRVMTYNIHHGEGQDGKVDILRIAQLIQRERADIVALQEVDKGCARTDRRDLPAELAALTGLTCVFSNNFSFQGGEYGNAVLTRFPVLRATNNHYSTIRGGEQRGLLQLVLDIHGRELVFMNTHLDHRLDDAERWSSVGEIEARMQFYGQRPVILCGDFNATPESRVSRRLGERFHDTWARIGHGDGFTLPSNQPSQRIDYIWTTKDKRLAPLRAWVPASAASDHLPVVAEFHLYSD